MIVNSKSTTHSLSLLIDQGMNLVPILVYVSFGWEDQLEAPRLPL